MYQGGDYILLAYVEEWEDKPLRERREEFEVIDDLSDDDLPF